MRDFLSKRSHRRRSRSLFIHHRLLSLGGGGGTKQGRKKGHMIKRAYISLLLTQKSARLDTKGGGTIVKKPLSINKC